MAKWIFISGVAAVLAADAVLFAGGGYDATITAWIRANPNRAGVVGVLIGMLIGHLYLGTKSNAKQN